MTIVKHSIDAETAEKAVAARAKKANSVAGRNRADPLSALSASLGASRRGSVAPKGLAHSSCKSQNSTRAAERNAVLSTA